jgi:aspartyl/asparaginyl beta-hydroxylase (cupin superfamily)/Tfp pilus assembly protein PilF
MQTPTADIVQTAQAGLRALNGGDPGQARTLFERVVESGQADASLFHGLAIACRAVGDPAAAIAAAQRSLALEPRSIGVLLLKADLHAEAGDRRAAAIHYEAVLRIAPRESAPPQLAAELKRATALSQAYNREYEAHLLSRLDLQTSRSTRVAESLDLMFGRKAAFQQQPSVYYFPGLPQIQFYNREQFPWAAAVEAAAADIRAELLEVMEVDGAFKPYMVADPDQIVDDPHGLANNPDWSSFYLIRGGRVQADNAARCPRTLEALRDVPLTDLPGKAPSVMFSRLEPGARIGAHNGFVNIRLICHLPLVVPEGCRLRVGNEVRPWREGELLVFDDSIEHEAWNDSAHARVVLLFDVWRPELTEEERGQVKALFSAIDAYADPQRSPP